MLILGEDIGHNNAKSCIGESNEDLDIFRSTIADVDTNILGEEDPIIIKYKGREIAVGTKYGNYSVEDDKSKDDIYKICLFTSVARSMKKDIEEVSIVTGLPINCYKMYRDTLEESLEGQTVKLEYKGSIKIMNFANVKAYPESAGIVILDKDKYKGPYLVVDIGGRTVDVSYFEGTKLVKTGSYDLGMLTLYSNIVKFVNDRNPTDYGVIAAENIIKTHTITVDGDDKLFDPTRLMKEHTEEILRRVKLDFPWKTSKRVFIGGGAYELKEFIPGGNKIRLEDIFLNAKVFYKVGVDKYGGN